MVNSVNKYALAVNGFRMKYKATPGDMRNATSFWGTASGGCPRGSRSGTQTCNGNGNGAIEHTYAPGWSVDVHESFLFWQHMANAGMIEGTYSGFSTDPNIYTIDQYNVPQDNMGGMIAYFAYTPRVWSSATTTYQTIYNYQGKYENLYGFAIGAFSVNAYALLSPEEALSLDRKLDDGKAGAGRIWWTGMGTGAPFTNACVVGPLPSGILPENWQFNSSMNPKQACLPNFIF